MSDFTISSIEELEQWMIEQSRIYELLPARVTTPVTLCRTLEEFIKPQYADSEMSETHRDARIRKAERIMQYLIEQEEELPMGVYLPGLGTFLNGFGIYQLYELDSVYQVFQHESALRTLISTLAHEKFGHGFLSECTSAGREQTTRDLFRLCLAKQFQQDTIDSPDGDFETEKINIIFDTRRFTDEGWAVWIEKYISNKTAGLVEEAFSSSSDDKPEEDPETSEECSIWGLYTIRKTAAAIAHYKRDEQIRVKAAILVDCLDRLNQMRYPPSLDIKGTESLDLALKFQEIASDKAFAAEFAGKLNELMTDFDYDGFIYNVGYLLMHLLENKFGPRCVVEAVRLASNVTLNINEAGINKLKEQTRTVTKANIDARLIQLLFLESEDCEGDNPDQFKQIAWDYLNYPHP